MSTASNYHGGLGNKLVVTACAHAHDGKQLARPAPGMRTQANASGTRVDFVSNLARDSDKTRRRHSRGRMWQRRLEQDVAIYSRRP